uniref:Uncharacterized protein n=1 Tax=Acidithiobacillus sulfuriphilus TaxID=1867749 RepID=A0A3M8QZB9_9PROT|nr:hypothetical protein EC580_08110 [Acidithiobacillus sulfuriphilus]
MRMLREKPHIAFIKIVGHAVAVVRGVAEYHFQGLEQVHEPHIKPPEDKLWEIRAKAICPVMGGASCCLVSPLYQRIKSEAP